MSVQLAPAPVFQGLGFGGLPLPGGKLFSYQAGTNTPQATFTDSTGIAQNTNPVILNANGQANVWLTVGLTYKLILQDQFGNQIWSVDNVPGGISLNLSQQALGQIIYPTLPGEVGVTNNIYPYGCPRRFGAVGNGIVDDTIAVQNAITSSSFGTNAPNMYWGWPGDSYAVQSITWPPAGPATVHFNGSALLGIATSPTTCISQIKCSFTTFYDYLVSPAAYLGVIPNSNYICCTWWFNGHITVSPTAASDGPSQFITFYGMFHENATRGLVYGQLPGSGTSASNVHSENKIYGFQSIGVSNPFFSNSSTGFVHMYGSVFFRDVSTWNTPTMPSTGRALENSVGSVFIHGGEIVTSNSTVGFSCDLGGTYTVIDNTYFELATPLKIFGPNVRLANCSTLTVVAATPFATVDATATGTLELSACIFNRSSPGATDRTTFINGTAAPAFEVIMDNCTSTEWPFVMAGANVKLIQGCIAVYNNHRLSNPSIDSNVYRLNSSPRLSIIPDLTLDHLGYTVTGWILAIGFGGGTTLANNTNAGPTGYLASQLDLHATGVSSALTGDPTSLATLKSTAQRCTPSEAFWLSSWINQGTSGGLLGGQTQLIASFYNLSGAAVSTSIAADVTSIGTNTWSFVEGPAVVPATAAYVLFGVTGTTTDALITDFRIQRAS